MIDDNFKIVKAEAKIYPPLPKNIYQVELLTVDLKEATGQFAKEGEQNFVFQFTLLAGKDGEEDLRGRNVWNNFVHTVLYIGKNGKNSLYQIVEAFLGRELTPQEEAEGINGSLLNSFIGKQIKVFVDHKASKKDPTKIFDNITSYMPAESQMKPLDEKEKDDATVKNKPEEAKQETGEQFQTLDPPTVSGNEVSMEDINLDNPPY